MFIAIDENNKPVDAFDASKEKDYFCPVCHNKVIVREGKINIKHFAHQSSTCSDTWHYDMSEWHKNMQSFFPLENREVVVEAKGKIHRADILVDKTVIEFQHSPISEEEFNDRNHFFINNGYRIAWVFDLTEQRDDRKIDYCNNDNDYLFKWNNPMRVLSYSPDLKGDKYALWLNWNIDGEIDCIYKVEWAPREYGLFNFKRFIVSKQYIDLTESFDLDLLFSFEKNNYFEQKYHELVAKKTNFDIKYFGVKGKKPSQYVCPKTPNVFGISIYGENGCNYCKYCWMLTHKKDYNKNTYVSYCCYPTQVNKELGNPDSDYNYNAEMIEL